MRFNTGVLSESQCRSEVALFRSCRHPPSRNRSANLIWRGPRNSQYYYLVTCSVVYAAIIPATKSCFPQALLSQVPPMTWYTSDTWAQRIDSASPRQPHRMPLYSAVIATDITSSGSASGSMRESCSYDPFRNLPGRGKSVLPRRLKESGKGIVTDQRTIDR